MHALKLKRFAAVAIAGAVSLGLSIVVLAGPPVAPGFNAAQDAVRMSMLRSAMTARTTAATQKTAATNQKATTATHTTGQPNQTCGSPTALETPGHAASAPGSPFNHRHRTEVDYGLQGLRDTCNTYGPLRPNVHSP